jgi:hypothetical protein
VISERGLAIIREFEGLPPSRLRANLIDGGHADAVLSGDGRDAPASNYSAVDCSGLIDGQLRPRVRLSSKINKAVAPLKRGVPGERHPFKVRRPVVGLDAVNVVDGKAAVVPGAERGRDKPVNQILRTLVANLDGYRWVAAWLADVRGEHHASPKLRVWKSSAGASRNARQRAYAPSAAYFYMRRSQRRDSPFFLCVRSSVHMSIMP